CAARRARLQGRLSSGAVSDDPLATVRSRTQANLFWRHLGVAVEDARPGWVRLRLPVRNELCNAAGAPLHGGVLASLVDMAVGGALATMGAAAAGGVDQATLDVNVSFMGAARAGDDVVAEDRKSTRLNSSHVSSSYAVFCLKKKTS